MLQIFVIYWKTWN